MNLEHHTHRLLMWLASQRAYMIEKDRDLRLVVYHGDRRSEFTAGPGDSLLDLLDMAYEEIHLGPARAAADEAERTRLPDYSHNQD